MFTEFAQWLQKYLDRHKESFAEHIRQTDIYHPDGTINKTTIQGTAQHHADMLRGSLSAETLRELRQHLSNCLSLQDLQSAAVFLCLYFMPFMERLPIHSLQLTADEQAFQCFIECLVTLLDVKVKGKEGRHALLNI